MKKLYFLLVACALMMPITGMAQNNTDKGETQQLLLTTEQQPQFPGGLVELSRFIQANMKYPAEAQRNGIQGKVVLQFIVTTTGEVKDVEVLRSVDPELDAEAVRICQMLPRFTPGTLGGKPVNVKYALPINFTLNQEVPDITDESLARANAGDPDAQYNVGCCYHKGLGVPVDWIVARYYLGLAAAQGHTKAAQLLEKTKQNLKGELDPPYVP